MPLPLPMARDVSGAIAEAKDTISLTEKCRNLERTIREGAHDASINQLIDWKSSVELWTMLANNAHGRFVERCQTALDLCTPTDDVDQRTQNSIRIVRTMLQGLRANNDTLIRICADIQTRVDALVKSTIESKSL